jgi:hypothetical protein
MPPFEFRVKPSSRCWCSNQFSADEQRSTLSFGGRLTTKFSKISEEGSIVSSSEHSRVLMSGCLCGCKWLSFNLAEVWYSKSVCSHSRVCKYIKIMSVLTRGTTISWKTP